MQVYTKKGVLQLAQGSGACCGHTPGPLVFLGSVRRINKNIRASSTGSISVATAQGCGAPSRASAAPQLPLGIQDTLRAEASQSYWEVPALLCSPPVPGKAMFISCSPGPPFIVSPPENITVNISQDALLTCRAEAYPGNLTYTWYWQDENVYFQK